MHLDRQPPSSQPLRRPRLALTLLLTGLGLGPAAHAAGSCSASSPRATSALVELYTSEGCNSCPPADRWLSKLKADPSVVALAFHVDYWDRLGWKDRFASAAFTERQAQQQASNGARFSYTPQVVVDGRDRTDWPSASVPAAGRGPSPVAVTLTRDGATVVATVAAAADATSAPRRLAAYWAVTEQGHVSAVRAGENSGVTLHHDFVVRDYALVPAWTARNGAAETLRFQPQSPADAAHPRSVNLVVVDAANGRPVQALKIDC